MLVAGVFFAGLLGYALVSRRLDAVSVTPQLAMLVLGVIAGLAVGPEAGGAGDHELLRTVGEIALILCLFVDAARMDFGTLRGTALLPARLLLIGLPLTIVSGAIVAVLVMPGLARSDVVLLALLLAPTDAALGALVVNSRSVPTRVRQALNVESGLNDGLVTPLVLVAAAVAAAGTSDVDPWLFDATSQIVRGTVVGVVVGAGAAWLLREALRRDWIHDGAHWVAAPAIAFLAWYVAHESGGNAFVAAFVAGLATAAVARPVSHDLLEFGEIGGELLGLVVFFLVGFLLPSAGPFDASVWVYAVLSLTVIRMVPVAVALVGTRLSRASVLFMGWFGPRGLASVVLALVAIDEVAGTTGRIDPVVLTTVLLTIALSVIAHGLSAGPAVAALTVRLASLPEGVPEHGPSAELRTRRRTVVGPRPGQEGVRTAGLDAP